jgi:hypothetical protein
VKRITILALMAALAALQLGCGGPAIGDLRSITLTVSANSSSSTLTNLSGMGSTLQLAAIGNYSTGATQDISTKVTFAATPTGTDDTGAALPNPVTATCTAPACGGIMLNPTGMVTAVPTAVCTWIDTAQAGSSTATWVLSGSYQIVASVHGINSQPVFITVASAASSTNPTGQCGP